MSTVFYTRAAKCFSKTPGRRPPHVTGRRAKIVSFVVAVFTLTHRYNAVRGHRTGSNNSGEELSQEESKIKRKIIHTTTETNRITSDKNKKVGSAYVRIKIHTYIYISCAKQVAAGQKPRRQHINRYM